MTRFAPLALLGSLLAAVTVAGQSTEPFVALFNGRDLAGWVNVNTAEDTWASATVF